MELAIMATMDTAIERYEAKYVIPSSLVGPIRDFLAPYCRPDPHGSGTPPCYTITTLQLDGPGLPLHRAKAEERPNRFKLRVRTYEGSESPVFLEVKRKYGDVVVKRRARIARADWGPHLLSNTDVTLAFKSDEEYLAFLEFVRLAREIHAEPVVRIRYARESYFAVAEEYARVSFDHRIEYQPATSWEVEGVGGKWIALDSDLVQNKMCPWSGVILELKSSLSVPRWMSDMTREFDLVRDGNCKYSTAVLSEIVFRGGAGAPAYLGALQDY